ncbi:PRA1 family protein F2 [Linum grandiflorum]
MTRYGTIQSQQSQIPSSAISPISLQSIRSNFENLIATAKPWKLMIQPKSLTFPSTLDQSLDRINVNAAFFRSNYAILACCALFISLLWHPFSFIVSLLLGAAWLFLYLHREDGNPLVINGQVVGQKTILTSLLSATMLVLFFTEVTEDIVVGLFAGVVLIVAHGALRETDDLPMMIGGEGLVDDLEANGSTSAVVPGSYRDIGYNSVNAAPKAMRHPPGWPVKERPLNDGPNPREGPVDNNQGFRSTYNGLTVQIATHQHKI